MASSGERRMLFDTRGKRKHVIRVVYAILALLMGGSLFLVVGPVNLAELFNTSSSSEASKVFDEQAERIETRLVRDPENEQLLLQLTRAKINAGNSQIEAPVEGQVPVIEGAAREDFDAAAEAWSRYLKQAGDEANATASALVAGTFFRLAEGGSATLGEVEENVAKATQAQRIAAEQQPSLGSLSTLAIDEYFNGNFAAGDKAAKEAAAKVPTKSEAKGVEKELAEYRKRAKEFKKNTKQIAKQEQKAGKESLQNPFGGLGGG